MTGRRRRGLGGLLALALAGACTTGEGDATPPLGSTTTIPVARTVLRVASADWPSCFEPISCDTGLLGDLLLDHTMLRLFDVDVDGNEVAGALLAGEPVPVLQPDGTMTIEYVLDEMARWHDDRPVTSSDLHASWRAHVATPGAAHPVHDLVVDVDDRDPLRAVVTLSRASSDWRQLFGGFDGRVLPSSALVASADLTGSFPDAPPPGSGPYEVLAIEDDLIVLDAVRDHWDDDLVPAIDQVRIERLDPDPALWPDLGGYDVVAIEPGDPRLTGRPLDGFAVVDAPAAAVTSVFFDLRTPVLQERAVRLAISQVVGEDDLVDLLPSGIPIRCPGWLTSDPACATAPDEARTDPGALLDSAGFTRTGGAGGRSRDGVPLALPISFDPAVPGAGTLAAALRFRLRTLGIEVDVRELPTSAFLDPSRTESSGVGAFTVPTGTTADLARLLACPDELLGVDDTSAPAAVTSGPLVVCDPEIADALEDVEVSFESGARDANALLLSGLLGRRPAFLPVAQVERGWLVNLGAVDVPEQRRPGAGPLGDLHRWTRTG